MASSPVRSFLLLILLFSGLLPAAAQKDPGASKTDAYDLDKEIKHPSVLLPFQQIRFTDYRFDTTKEGFYEQYTSFLKFHFAGGAAASLQNWFDKISGKTSEASLHIVIRSLWLRDLKAAEINIKEFPDRSRISQFIVKMDAYMVRDSQYQAALRIDTVYSVAGDAGSKKEALLTLALHHIANKISGISPEALQKKNKFSAAQVFSQYEKLHQKAKAIETASLRGIYFSFEDFVNNKIAVVDFVIEENETADYLYIIEKGEQKLNTSFWGFAEDGKKFIRVSNNFFPLIPDQQTFSFWGCYRAVHLNAAARSERRIKRYVLFGVFGELHHSRLKNQLRPMQVDMETGNVY